MINRENDPRKAMKTPDGFFETFEKELMAKIESKPSEVKVWTLKRMASIAAALVVAVAIVFVIRMYTPSSEIGFADLSLEENWRYLIENPEVLTYEDFYSFEESAESLQELEEEIFGSMDEDKILEEIDLETLELIYE